MQTERKRCIMHLSGFNETASMETRKHCCVNREEAKAVKLDNRAVLMFLERAGM